MPIYYHFTVGRYLITGGYAPGYPSDEIPRDELTEVVELVKTNCPTPSFAICHLEGMEVLGQCLVMFRYFVVE